jgi:hypothetical protein
MEIISFLATDLLAWDCELPETGTSNNKSGRNSRRNFDFRGNLIGMHLKGNAPDKGSVCATIRPRKFCFSQTWLLKKAAWRDQAS